MKRSTTGLGVSRGAWIYRQRIPKALQDLFGGRSLLFEYIGATSSIRRRDAETRARQLRLSNDLLFERARHLTPAQRQEAIKAGGLDKLEALDAGVLRLVGAALDGLDVEEVDPDLDLTDPAAQALAGEQLLHARLTRALHRDLKSKAPKIKRSPSLDALLDVWRDRTRPRSAGTVAKARLWLDRFADYTGGKDLDEITREDARGFRNFAEASTDWTRETAREGMSKLNVMFQHGTDAGLVDFNPFEGLRVHVPRPDSFAAAQAKKEKGLDDVEVGTILDRDNLDELPTEAHVWAIKLALYMGLRLGECSNIRAEDLVEVDGIPCLSITDAGEGQTVKTVSSVRVVPLHKDLAGFLDFAKGRAGHILDEDPPAPNLIRRRRRLQDPINAWLKSIGVRATAHSLRHTFRNACRSIEMPVEISSALMGHMVAGVHASYGRRPSIKILKGWIDRIDPRRA